MNYTIYHEFIVRKISHIEFHFHILFICISFPSLLFAQTARKIILKHERRLSHFSFRSSFSMHQNFAFPCLLSLINYPKHWGKKISEKLLIKFSIFPFSKKKKNISDHPSPNPPAIPTTANSFFAKSRLNPIHDLRVSRRHVHRHLLSSR